MGEMLSSRGRLLDFRALKDVEKIQIKAIQFL